MVKNEGKDSTEVKFSSNLHTEGVLSYDLPMVTECAEPLIDSLCRRHAVRLNNTLSGLLQAFREFCKLFKGDSLLEWIRYNKLVRDMLPKFCEGYLPVPEVDVSLDGSFFVLCLSLQLLNKVFCVPIVLTLVKESVFVKFTYERTLGENVLEFMKVKFLLDLRKN